MLVKKDSTNISVEIYIIDSTDGTPETGVVWNTGGIDLNYRRDLAAVVSITEATLALLTTAWTEGGFLHVANGRYRLDVPDAAFATGVSKVTIGGTVTGMVVLPVTVQLVDFDPDDAVRLGLTSLPNAAADAAGGLPISDAGGLALDTQLAATNEVTAARMAALTDWIDGGRLDLLLDAIKVPTDKLVFTVANQVDANTLSVGGTAQTAGDVPALVTTVDTVVDTINTNVGTAGAGLTDLGGMSTGMKAEVESEANDALVAQKLDHLVAVADADDPVDGSIIASMVSTTADWSLFAEATDALQAIRDRGDAAWTTGAGGSDRLLMVDTTIATLSSQTSFTLTAGSTDDNAYLNCTIVIEDVSTSTQKAIGLISAYTGSTKTVTLKYDPAVFTMAATDKVYILAENSLKSTAQNRQLDVTTTGAAGIDWGNVENPTTALDLSGTDIQLVDTVTTYTGDTPQTADHTAALTTAQADLDTLTGTDGATLATAQANYAPAIAGDAMILTTAGILAVWDQALTAVATAGSVGKLLKDEVTSVRMATLTDWIDGGRLDLLVDAIKAITDQFVFTVANEVDSNILSINGNTEAAQNLSRSARTIELGTVDTVTNTHTPTTTEFQCDDITEATTDHFKGRSVYFNTGVLAKQATDITGYSLVGGIGQFTVTAMTEAPADNDTLTIV